MTLEELRLQRLVQGIFVRNYVDTSRLSIEVIGSSVYVEGDFIVYDYHPGMKRSIDLVERDLSVRRTLYHIEQQIRSLPEVQHLEMKFNNWERRGLQWVPKTEFTS